MSIDRNTEETGGSRASISDGAHPLRRLGGLSTTEAANIIAYLSGPEPGVGRWTPREIERLLFVDWLVAAGRLKS
jgi:hypothetical protein